MCKSAALFEEVANRTNGRLALCPMSLSRWKYSQYIQSWKSRTCELAGSWPLPS